MNAPHIAIGLGIILLIAGAAYYGWEKGFFREHRRVAVLFSETALRAYAAERGTAALIEYVINAGAPYTSLNSHQIGHALGTVIYEREGTGGIALCGDIFTYGCLHQVIGQAYAEQGQGSFENLLDICKTQNYVPAGDCLHALGHGLVYAGGYRESDLGPILALCDKTQQGIPFDYEDSCLGGAFMEYNMHFMSDNEGAYTKGRPFDEASPFAPCDALSDERHRTTCAFWLLPWYHGQYDSWRFNEDSFSHLGDYCDSMPQDDMRVACIYAIGREASVNGVPGGVTSDLCMAAADDATEFDMCIFGAVHILERRYPEKVAPLCNVVAAHRKDACTAFAKSPETRWDAVQ